MDVSIELAFDADFQDVFAIRGLLGSGAGRRRDPQWLDGDLRFAADGADGVMRSTRIAIEPDPVDRDGSGCRVEVAIGPRAERRVSVRIRAEERRLPGAAPLATSSATGLGMPDESDSADGLPVAGGPAWGVTIRSEALALDSVLARSMADLRTLIGRLDGQRYYAAGMPWFSALFGRDSLIAAYQTLAFDPAIAAEHAAAAGRAAGDARTTTGATRSPGKILHELRVGELARLDEIPQTPYYGSIDSTPLFLIVLAEHAAWTGTLDLFRELPIERRTSASEWIDRDGDARRRLARRRTRARRTGGLANQGWKDSGDAIVDRPTAAWREPPIALAEVQGYVYRREDLDRRAVRAGRRRDAGRPAARPRPRTFGRASRRRSGPTSSAATPWPSPAHGRCEVVTSNAGPGPVVRDRVRRARRSGRRAALPGRHVRRLGDPDAVDDGRRLEPGRLPPRERSGRTTTA